MSTHIFPQVQGGYRWNMVQRIKNEVGIEPVNSCDVQMDGAWKTMLQFPRELTPVEISALETLMAGNPTQPPVSSGTVFKLDDLWEKLAQFNAATGVNFKLYYGQSTAGGPIDTLELHAPSTLTTAQKNAVKSRFGALIREV